MSTAAGPSRPKPTERPDPSTEREKRAGTSFLGPVVRDDDLTFPGSRCITRKVMMSFVALPSLLPELLLLSSTGEV